MQIEDFSPSASPSVDQRRDALQKGLGRAPQWAMTGLLDDDSLLAACLSDQRHDMQVEGPRGTWLWQMIRLLKAENRLRVPILDALHWMSDQRSASQLCELAFNYAEAGDEAFRTRLYEITEQKPVLDSPWLGEEEIVKLDGKKGFLFAAGVRGRSLMHRDWEWSDESLVADADKRLGEDNVRALLERATDEAIKHFSRVWLQQKARKAERKQRHNRKEAMQAITVDDIISEAEKDCSSIGRFRGWGMHATEDDLQIILQRLWTTVDSKALVCFLKVLSNRSLPEFDSRLIEFCRHNEEQVRQWAFRALAMNSHPLVREFALTELQGGVQHRFVLELFIRNYAKGDEARIIESVELPDDSCELHWLLMDVVKVLENNPEADCSQLGFITYGLTPCENCRFDAFRLLDRQRVAPLWMMEECRYDSNEQCRELAEKGAGEASD